MWLIVFTIFFIYLAFYPVFVFSPKRRFRSSAKLFSRAVYGNIGAKIGKMRLVCRRLANRIKMDFSECDFSVNACRTLLSAEKAFGCNWEFMRYLKSVGRKSLSERIIEKKFWESDFNTIETDVIRYDEFEKKCAPFIAYLVSVKYYIYYVRKFLKCKAPEKSEFIIGRIGELERRLVKLSAADFSPPTPGEVSAFNENNDTVIFWGVFSTALILSSAIATGIPALNVLILSFWTVFLIKLRNVRKECVVDNRITLVESVEPSIPVLKCGQFTLICDCYSNIRLYHSGKLLTYSPKRNIAPFSNGIGYMNGTEKWIIEKHDFFSATYTCGDFRKYLNVNDGIMCVKYRVQKGIRLTETLKFKEAVKYSDGLLTCGSGKYAILFDNIKPGIRLSGNCAEFEFIALDRECGFALCVEEGFRIFGYRYVAALYPRAFGIEPGEKDPGLLRSERELDGNMLPEEVYTDYDLVYHVRNIQFFRFGQERFVFDVIRGERIRGCDYEEGINFKKITYGYPDGRITVEYFETGDGYCYEIENRTSDKNIVLNPIYPFRISSDGRRLIREGKNGKTSLRAWGDFSAASGRIRLSFDNSDKVRFGFNEAGKRKDNLFEFRTPFIIRSPDSKLNEFLSNTVWKEVFNCGDNGLSCYLLAPFAVGKMKDYLESEYLRLCEMSVKEKDLFYFEALEYMKTRGDSEVMTFGRDGTGLKDMLLEYLLSENEIDMEVNDALRFSALCLECIGFFCDFRTKSILMEKTEYLKKKYLFSYSDLNNCIRNVFLGEIVGNLGETPVRTILNKVFRAAKERDGKNTEINSVLLRYVFYNILGVKVENNRLYFKPDFPEDWNFCDLRFRIDSANVLVTYNRGSENCVRINGIAWKNSGIPIPDRGDCTVEVCVAEKEIKRTSY